MSEYDYLFKLILIGDLGVGKTSFLANYLQEPFNADHRSTIGVEFRIKTVQIGGKTVKLQIWDTAGQERFRSITRAYYRGAHGVILLFDLTQRSSFEGISKWAYEVKDNASYECEMILVGNKCDLIHQREVATSEIEEFVEEKNLRYVETSALTGEGVEAAIMGLITGAKLPAPSTSFEPSVRRGRCGTKDLPLESVETSVKIIDLLAEVTMKLTYGNVGKIPLEVLLVLPKEKSVTVHFFETFNKVTGEKIQGIIMEKQKAVDKYSDTIASGKSAYLLEETLTELKASVGLLSEGESIEITIGYTMELSVELNYPVFHLPLTQGDTAISSKIQSSLNVDVVMSSEISSIETRSGAAIQVNKISGKRSQLFVKGSNPMGNDMDLLIKLKSPLNSRGRISEDSELGAAAMIEYISSVPSGSVLPPSELYELVFIIDRSGSMAGSPWNDASQAIQVFLRSLPTGCRFQIIGFGTGHEVLFSKGSQVYNENSMKEASSAIEKWSANLGGTELYQPLNVAYKMKLPSSDTRRRVFVITDGQVDNRSDVVQLADSKSNENCRTYSLGIGTGVDRALIELLGAKSAFEFTGPGESIQSKVIRLLKKGLDREFSSLSVEWKGAKPSYVTKLPNVMVVGDKLSVYALFPNTPDSNITAVVSGMLNGQRYSTPIEVELVNDIGRVLQYRAAKSVLTSLSKNDAIELSKKFGITSKYTSFLAISKNTKNEAQELTMSLTTIPFEQKQRDSTPIGSGSGGLMNRFQSQQSISIGASSPIAVMELKSASNESSAGCCGGGGSSSNSSYSAPRYSSPSASSSNNSNTFSNTSVTATPAKSTSSSPSVIGKSLDNLILLQHADGSWDLNQDLLNIIAVNSSTHSEIRKKNPDSSLPMLWATALALAFLLKYHQDKRDVWDMICEKGMDFLRSKKSDKVESESKWIELASNCIDFM